MIDPTKLSNLLALSVAGGQPALTAYWSVEWDSTDPSETRYYSDAEYHVLPPFQAVGVTIEAKILESLVKDTTFEVNSDLRTETINLKFDDIDKTISDKFKLFGSGVHCELFFFYPSRTFRGVFYDIDLTISMWLGQLQAPEVYGWKNLDCKATNGFRSREQLIPRRPRPSECTSNFGGLLTAEASETTICPYQKQNGGLGNFKTGSTPYSDCPRLTEAQCILRLGADARGRAKYFGGFKVDAGAVAFPAHHQSGYIAVSEGNASKLSDPIRVIAGMKHVRGLQLLLWSRITPPGEPQGFIDGVWEIGEGPIADAYNMVINDKFVSGQYGPALRKGGRGQSNCGYGANTVSNFSGTAHARAVHGYVDTGVFGPDLKAEIDVVGYNEVAVFDSFGAYVRQWTDDRVWWLMSLYENQRWGMAYPFSRFTTDDWLDASDWTQEIVTFTVTNPDGEQEAFPHRRTSFNAILEGRPAAEQIEDICRSGGLSVPFQHEGAFTISPFRKATAPELAAARTFTDTGEDRNIVWDVGQPSIKLSQVPNDKVVNEVEVTFEDSSNGDAARPITVDDPDQKVLAGRELGDNNLKAVPKKFSAFGVRALGEAIKIAYRFMRFGDFDSGGTQNNLSATLLVPFEQALGLKRYEVHILDSALLDGFTIGTGATSETPQYFRIMKMQKVAGGRCEIKWQAYNHTAYTAFETIVVTHVCSAGFHWDYIAGACVADGAGACDIGYHWNGVACVPDDPPPDWEPCRLTATATYDAVLGNIELDVPICP